MATTVKGKLVSTLFDPQWNRQPRGATMYLREGSTDVDVVDEVITRRCYRKPSIGLEIRQGEHWLDLGANIGAFAVCCYLHGATATCFEPIDRCFKLLRKNVPYKGFELCKTAVTVHPHGTLPVWESPKAHNFYRATIIETPAYKPTGTIPNLFVGDLIHNDEGNGWDGVKMDIEGSELAMIDEELLPVTEKLALEYHFCRDHGKELDPQQHFSRHPQQMQNFHRRMKALRKIFKTVSYPPYLNKIQRGPYPGRYDIIVHCIGRR